MNNTKYDIVIHTTKTNYISDPRKWDKRKLKRFLRWWIKMNDIQLITVAKYKPLKSGEDYFKNGLEMVADRLFIDDIKDIRKFK